MAPASYAQPPKRPGELAVVVDTMLQGLGKYLRNLGVDVEILEATHHHDYAAKVMIMY